MLTKDIFAQDPTSFKLPNDGVARVGTPTTPQEWETFRWELQSFVCEGAYEEGLSRILASYLAGISKPKQPAAWVSGFYGSGKSHLVRVLEALWTDVALPDGASARGLVRLPPGVRSQLTELSTAGRREGGLWAAAGTLSTGVGSSVRLAVMSLLFRAARLPEQYSHARFVLWLEEEGQREAVERALSNAGRTLAGELKNMYVSQHLAEALRTAIPDLATSVPEVHALLRSEYRDVSEIGSDEAASMLKRILTLRGTSGKLPLTLIVLDETQQFLAEDPNRTLELQDTVERFSAELGGRLLLVGTGQMQLGATPALQKLRDRFTVTVALTDADVDRVVRSVVLRKDPTRVGEVQRLLDRASGEIDRQLAGTRIGPRAADKADLVSDFPLLPARRRFWEAVLRSVDSVGRAGQLRAQLRIALEATQAVAPRPLGSVIAGDAIYDPIMADLQQSGELPRDTAALIAKLSTGGATAALPVRIAKLAFLFGRLEETGPLATGVRATAESFADLLIDDLTLASEAIRQRVNEAVAQLADSGVLLNVDGQFVLQTPIAAEWIEAFKKEQARLKNDQIWIADKRAEAIRTAIAGQLGKLQVGQGVKNKVNRRLALSFSDSQPPAGTGDVPVWIRDGWSVAQGQVSREAQTAGTESPLVFVFVPREESDAIRDAMATVGAAKSTVEVRPPPPTEEGANARSGISSRGVVAQQRLDSLIAALLGQAIVYQGGGTEVSGGTLGASVEQAAKLSVVRLYPKFDVGDEDGWGTVIQRAKDGSANPLSALKYAGDPQAHPVCAEILRHISAGQKTGKEIRTSLQTTPFGWPQDTIDGALYALLAVGLVQARVNNSSVTPKTLAQNAIGTVVFRPEGVVLSAEVRVQVKGLAAQLGVPVASIGETEIPDRIIAQLVSRAQTAGGEPPLPGSPTDAVLKQLQGLSGNELTKGIYDQRAHLQSLAKTWIQLSERKSGRVQEWQELEALLRHASDGPEKAAARSTMDAILENRSLLSDPDPVAPLVQQLAEALRRQLLDGRAKYRAMRKDALTALKADPLWQKLGVAQQEQILTKQNLDEEELAPIDTPTALISALDQMNPRQWSDRLAALPARVLQARADAARLLEPQAVSVKPPSATIRNEMELTQYLDALRDEILAHLRADHPVVL